MPSSVIHVFDTNSLRVLANYYPARFPSFWKHFEAAFAAGEVMSVKEARKELEAQATGTWFWDWVVAHTDFFPPPSPDEMTFVAKIFAVPHFRTLIGETQRLRGLPVADPFVIASAAVRGGCVVTEEARKQNAARIPNVCGAFKVPCTNVEGFLESMQWRY